MPSIASEKSTRHDFISEDLSYHQSDGVVELKKNKY